MTEDQEEMFRYRMHALSEIEQVGAKEALMSGIDMLIRHRVEAYDCNRHGGTASYDPMQGVFYARELIRESLESLFNNSEEK